MAGVLAAVFDQIFIKKMKLRAGIWMILAGIACTSAAQEKIFRGADTEELAGSLLENALDGTVDENIDSGMGDELIFLQENPVSINTDDIHILHELGLLTRVQVRNINDYRKKYGPYMSIYELKAVDGVERQAIEKIMPFVVVEKPGQAEKETPHRQQHELIMKAERALWLPEGYLDHGEQRGTEGQGPAYLGDPWRFYLRYRYESGKKVRACLLADKDPGEIFTFRQEVTTREGTKVSAGSLPGFDHYSLSIELKDLGRLSSLVLGDYHIRCGQGLVLWSGTSFAGSNSPSSFKRYARVVKTNTSAAESRYFRGLAGTLDFNKFNLSLFISRRRADARIEISEDGSFVSSMPETGYHRTVSELSSKGQMGVTSFGGHLAYASQRVRAGITAFSNMLDNEVGSKDDNNITGKVKMNTGVNIEYLLRGTVVFGEFGYSMNGGLACLAGITHTANNGSLFSLLLREYRSEYQNLMSGAHGRQSSNANERGVRLGMEAPLGSHVRLSLFTEHYLYPVVEGDETNIIRGQKHEIILSWQPGRATELSCRYRSDRNVDNERSNTFWLDRMGYAGRQRMRVKLKHDLSDDISIKAQAEILTFRGPEEVSTELGSLLALDAIFKPGSKKIRLTARYALFNTDGYNSRLYAYEHDVLYSSSMPAYYGRGFRAYLILHYNPIPWFDAWVRLSLTNFTDRHSIGSGLSEISGNRKGEVKLQCRIKIN